MSAQLAIAEPRRIKATHRRRRKVTAGRFVQRYYDPQVGRFLSNDPVSTNPSNGNNFNRYWYGNNNPARFADPDGRLAQSGTADWHSHMCDIGPCNSGTTSEAPTEARTSYEIVRSRELTTRPIKDANGGHERKWFNDGPEQRLEMGGALSDMARLPRALTRLAWIDIEVVQVTQPQIEKFHYKVFEQTYITPVSVSPIPYASTFGLRLPKGEPRPVGHVWLRNSHSLRDNIFLRFEMRACILNCSLQDALTK